MRSARIKKVAGLKYGLGKINKLMSDMKVSPNVLSRYVLTIRFYLIETLNYFKGYFSEIDVGRPGNRSIYLNLSNFVKQF